MNLFHFDDMATGYLELVDALKRDGRPRSPRGQLTYELPNTMIVLEDPTKSHPVGIGRRYSPAIAAAEAACLIGGVTDPNLMMSAGSNFRMFLDLGALHGTYGPRIRGQLPNVVERLREDRDTRQAILQVWDARYDQAGWVPKDLPCTLMFGFSIFDGKLEMQTTMRSNDVWWGVAHDFPMFTALQLTVASALGLEPGRYTHTAYSFHMYDRDVEAAEQQLHEPDDDIRWPGGGFYSEGGIEQGTARARDLLMGEHLKMPTPAERWYIDTLAPHIERAHQSRARISSPAPPNHPA